MPAVDDLKGKIFDARMAKQTFGAGLKFCAEFDGKHFYFQARDRVLAHQVALYRGSAMSAAPVAARTRASRLCTGLGPAAPSSKTISLSADFREARSVTLTLEANGDLKVSLFDAGPSVKQLATCPSP